MINVSLKTKAKEVDGNYVLDGITIGRVTDLKPNEWFGKVMLSNVGEEFAEYGLLDPMAIVEGDDGVTYKDPKGGSDGSRGTLLEPDGTPSVNVSSFDNDEDFFKALGESKANEDYENVGYKNRWMQVIESVWDEYQSYSFRGLGYTPDQSKQEWIKLAGARGIPEDVAGRYMEYKQTDQLETFNESKANEIGMHGSDGASFYDGKTFTCSHCGKVGDSFTDMAQEECPNNDRGGHQIPIFGDQLKSKRPTRADLGLEVSKANEYEEELPDERSESELETDTSYEDSLYGDPAYPSSDPRNWYKKGSQWKVVGDDPDDIDELTGESKANEGLEDSIWTLRWWNGLTQSRRNQIINNIPRTAIPSYLDASNGIGGFDTDVDFEMFPIQVREYISTLYKQESLYLKDGESKASEEMSLHEQLLQHFSVHTSPDPEQRGSSFIGVGKCRICGEKVEFNSGDEKIEVMDNHLRKEHDEVFPLKGSWAYDRFGANENSNWKAFNNAQRQEIIDLADVSVSADTEWEDISVPDQEDLSIQLVSQGALANADFTAFADEYVNELKLDGLNVKNHVRETLRDGIHNWKKMDRDVRREDSEMAGIDQDVIDTIVDMSLDKIRKQFPEEHKKLDNIGVWGFGESRASEYQLGQDMGEYELAKRYWDGEWEGFGDSGDEIESMATRGAKIISDSDKEHILRNSKNVQEYGIQYATSTSWDDLSEEDMIAVIHWQGLSSLGESKANELLSFDQASTLYSIKIGLEPDIISQDSLDQLKMLDLVDDNNNLTPEGYRYTQNLQDQKPPLRDPEQKLNYTRTEDPHGGHYWDKYDKSWESKANENDHEELQKMEKELVNKIRNMTVISDSSVYEEQQLKDLLEAIRSMLNDVDNWTFTGDWAGTSQSLQRIKTILGESKANESGQGGAYRCNVCDHIKGNVFEYGMLECQCGCHNSATTHWKDYYWDDGVMGTVGVDLDETSVTMESKANEEVTFAGRGEITSQEELWNSLGTKRRMWLLGIALTDEDPAESEFLATKDWSEVKHIIGEPYFDLQFLKNVAGIESKANEGDWENINAEDEAELDSQITTLEVAYYKEDDVNEQTNILGELERLRGIKRKFESGELPNTLANENVASKMAYYYQNDAPKDWNDNQVSNEAEKILEETYGIKPKKEVVKEEAKESLSTVQQKIVDRKLDGVRNESIIHELKIWDNMSEEQAKKAVETTEIPLQDSIAHTLFSKKYAECNENERQELKIYAGESRAKEGVNDELLSTDAGIVKFLEGRGASRYYIDFVLRFPNSPSPAGWIRHWKDGFMDFGGGFGSALFDGDLEDAYFRADGENRGNLQKMGIRFARDDGTFDTIEDGRITGYTTESKANEDFTVSPHPNLLSDYVKRYPNSSVAGDTDYPSTGGHFFQGLHSGDLCEAWTRADLENREIMKEITGYSEEYLNKLCYDNKWGRSGTIADTPTEPYGLGESKKVNKRRRGVY